MQNFNLVRFKYAFKINAFTFSSFKLGFEKKKVKTEVIKTILNAGNNSLMAEKLNYIRQRRFKGFGVGNKIKNSFLKKYGLNTRLPILTVNSEIPKYIEYCFYYHLEFFLVKKKLKQIVERRLYFLKSQRHYRGARLRRGLPVRGQRTRTNAKTAKRFRPKIEKKAKKKVRLAPKVKTKSSEKKVNKNKKK